ncbi:pirin family protein [Mangrovivirga cuniculi]|uniref:pirin family protein n=1 Tax=Mangrovivirga cuniculi TaxID=2715131 RepID=UPI003743F107
MPSTWNGSRQPFFVITPFKNRQAFRRSSIALCPPHPHRGFCPVSLVFEGAVEHKDSLGNEEVIEEGGVQWITAGKGIIHSEKEALKESGKKYCDFQLIQLWINLREEDKLSEPSYLPLTRNQLPKVPFQGRESEVKLISGNYRSIVGPERRTSDINIFTIESVKGEHLCFDLPHKHQVIVYQLEGVSRIGNDFIEPGIWSISNRKKEK